MIKLKQLFLAGAMAVAMGSMAQTPANYRPAVYPQQQTTAGTAVLEVSETADATEYLFRNDVLDAKFVKDSSNHLTFGGSTAMDLVAGTELFTVKMGTDGATSVQASQMTLVGVTVEELPADVKPVKGAEHFAGKRLVATFTTNHAGANLTVKWTAELRDGSHYLKTGVELKTDKDVRMFAVVPMQYNVDVTASGMAAPAPVGDSRLRGRIISNDKIFACLDTPMGINTAGTAETPTINPEDVVGNWTDTWETASWKAVESGKVPQKIVEAAFDAPHVYYKDYEITVEQVGFVSVEFHYGGVGSHGLNICGVEVLDNVGSLAGSDYHNGFAGSREQLNTYTIDIKDPGTYTVRMYVQDKTETIDSKGNIKLQYVKRTEEIADGGDVVPVQGLWSRKTNLTTADTWKVGSVVGLMAPEEGRRSVLAYLERERAVPWRPYPIYNSWYELNINRTNKNVDPANNLKVGQTVEVMEQWKKNMFDTQGVSIQAFVWDDGWDQYGTWGFNAGFPNGFTEPDVIGRQMCSGQGAWLGPCGGYDVAGNQRQQYWRNKGQECNLYNKDYYNVFVGACRTLCKDYDFRYFKFDGISSLGTAYGPNMSATNGEEDAEGIISVENDVRYNIKEDIFFNTTVGTWASPLWLNISDAVWRQENDHGYKGGNTNKREQWITYRDNLVYEHFVQESPLMTINSMMTHGVLLSNYGGPNDMPKDYASVLREMRCAFACGSGQVELYCDYSLLNSIRKDPNDANTAGALWKDLADLIKWQRANADVLPDIHWVGDDPYTSKENVYGWAAWNGNKAVFSLRNGYNSPQTFTTTLRKALNIPSSVHTQITLNKSFADQLGLDGLTEGTPIDIDQNITVTLPASSVYMFDGLDANGKLVLVESITFDEQEVSILAGRAKAPVYSVAPLAASNKSLTWESADSTIATVKDGAITGVKPGTTTITAKTLDGSNKVASIKVTVLENLQNDLEQLIEQAQADYDAHDVGLYSDGIITLPSQFSSEFTETKQGEGDITKLIDNDGSTFWHSKWTGGKVAAHTHYLQVTLPEPISGTIQMDMMRRINGTSLCANDNPILMSVEVSADGTNWSRLDGQMELPLGSAAELHVYGTFNVAEPVRYFRFFSDQNNGDNQRGYWHCGDFQLHRLEQEAPNTLHATEAEALKAAIVAARGVDTATAADIAALQQAYDAYKAVIGKAVVILTGFELPIPNGVYEIVNAPTRDNRGYLVDYTTRTDGPSLAECRLDTHEGKHPAARNSETTSSYWYVHEKGGKYYIVSLSALQADADPRFIVPGANVTSRTTYSATATPLTIKEHATYTYTEGEDTYKYMLIGNDAGNRFVSAACGTNSNDGAVKTDTNTNDGGAPWKFIRSNVSLTDTQLAIRAAAIRLIEADANIVRLTEFVDKAPSGETTISDINVVRDVILKK